MAIGTFFRVTLPAIAAYLVKARAADEKLRAANEAMKQAAEALLAIWEGDAAKAFAQEQGVLYQHVSQLGDVGEEYMSTLDAALKKHEEAEARVAAAIKG